MEFIPARLSEFSSTLANPTADAALVVLLGIGFLLVVVGMNWANSARRSRRYRSRPQYETTPPRPNVSEFQKILATPAGRVSDPADPMQQMKAVQACDFECTRLLNRSEARLLPILEAVARELNQGHRVMAQTCLGEIIRPKGSSSNDRNRLAYNAINAKRLDFALFDRSGYLVCAVEYQGTGHHQDNAFLRDAIKREALRKAGVTMLEIRPDFTPDLVAASVRAILVPQPGRIESQSVTPLRA